VRESAGQQYKLHLMAQMKTKRVLIIQSQIKQYRVPFFEKLHEALAVDGVTLHVAYSDPLPREAKKQDNQDLPAEYGKKVKGFWACGERILIQPLLGEMLAADLVIVEQANKYLLNHLFLPLSALGMKKLAFWGLGENKQADRTAISEWYKRRTFNWVAWWFAYTQGTARYLAENGVPRWKITAVNNAVDTREIREKSQRLGSPELNRVRQALGIGPEDPVGIYCGMLDPVKGLDFLLESARMIRKEISNFHLLIVGGGPEGDMLTKNAQGSNWIHWTGPRFGDKKILLLKISDALLAPGRVGLVILDAFAAGLPLLTTKLRIHGPEIEYLEDKHNGIMTEHQTGVYSRAVVELFKDRSRLRALQAGANASGEVYTIENMVSRFSQGIHSCLDTRKKHLAKVWAVRSQGRNL
jgi:glycosyltransferase involved in cell wall biosynthesis